MWGRADVGTRGLNLSFAFSGCWNFTKTRLSLSQQKVEMTSRSVSEGAFVHLESSPEDSIKDKSSNYRHPSVYDAVAGNRSLSLTYSVHALTRSRKNFRGRIHPKAPCSLYKSRHSIIVYSCSTSRISFVSKQKCSDQIRRIRHLLCSREAVADWSTRI